MDAIVNPGLANSREQLVHWLYEAAELEHNLMCTYLYAAFSLRNGEQEGLNRTESEAVGRWRRSIIQVAVEEMGHLAAVWNITSALGAAPRVGRMNFPLDAGYLPAGIVVKLAPFNADTLQHFIFLERPHGSTEPEGNGFSPERAFARGKFMPRLTPMPTDYDTVGSFYLTLKDGLEALVASIGEGNAFRGDRALQLAGSEYGFGEAKPVVCLKTALAAFDSIVAQGEGSPSAGEHSHYQKFVAIRTELAALRAVNACFEPAFPAATNPVLRKPPRPEGRVWLEDPEAVATVDLANASYGLMLRLLAYSYAVPTPAKSRPLELGIALMRAIAPLGEHAARLPAGPSNPDCHAGMSFTTLRDSAAFPAGPAAESFFLDRLLEFAAAARTLGMTGAARLQIVDGIFTGLARRAQEYFAPATPVAPVMPAAATTPTADGIVDTASDSQVPGSPASVEVAASEQIEIRFETRRCIHSRFCVTGAPAVFLANVKGPWIHPEAMPVERLVDVAHACPSGAIRYARRDGQPDEAPPPVNLVSVREAGPYAFRGDLRLGTEFPGYRVTLCRCGASRNKPFCDGSHHEVGFAATGEPPTGNTDMLPVRNGTLSIEPELNGPLRVSGNLEITSGTGRVVARVEATRLCRCGGSQNKPFCDGTHAKIGFRS